MTKKTTTTRVSTVYVLKVNHVLTKKLFAASFSGLQLGAKFKLLFISLLDKGSLSTA